MVGSTDANQLMRAGLAAFAKGDHREAHDLWRQSASLRPNNEQVWLALLSVVKTREDKRVCLENILHINPDNAQAARQLQDLTPYPSALPMIQTSSFMRRLLVAFGNVLRLAFNLLLLIVFFIIGIALGVSLHLAL